VGQGGFVYGYQCFEHPRFARRQSGANDFRLQLNGADDTPFRVARPWLQPYRGEVKDFVDRNTLAGKVMTGYQGWFATPNDAVDGGWRHWGRTAAADPSPTEITIDMWPWTDEYRSEDLYPAGKMVLRDGQPAKLFSSNDPATVQRHFRWMRKHNIDGAYVQRFLTRNTSGAYGSPEFVLSNVRAAANQEGRVWAIMYDISSLTRDANPLEVFTNDWNFLVNDVGILEDARYAHEDGKPVLAIWGFSVPGREGITLEEADSIVDWFKDPARGRELYLVAGVRNNWQRNTNWYAHYRKYDLLFPWMEPSAKALAQQKAQLEEWGMKLLPHTWPGFAWHNLRKFKYPQQYAARGGGQFYWERLYNAVSVGADQLYLGMFDEYDEATAIMPMSDNHPEPHTEWGHYINNEGRDPFWWLRLSDAARDMLTGYRPLSATLPAADTVSAGACAGDDATVYLGVRDREHGLVRKAPPDGQITATTLGGHACRTLDEGSRYFYFAVDDNRVFQKAAGQRATIEIEFYDHTAGTAFRLQYDGVGGSETAHPDVYTSQGRGIWRNLRWTLDDGYFGGRQSAGADFRIEAVPGVAIRRASLFFPE